MTKSFSLTAIQKAATEVHSKEPEFFEAKDGIKLAYYSFVPKQVKTVIVFYHSASTWSMPLYQQMAEETCQKYNMAVYLIDIRGHGNSEGPRGDASAVDIIWDDIDVALGFVKAKHPNTFLILAGHSSGVGLILNYFSYFHSKEIEPDGYVFFAPFLGSDSETQIRHKKKENRFLSRVKSLTFKIYGFTGGRYCAHTPSLFFNNEAFRKIDPLIIPFYTCTMTMANFPQNSKKILAQISKPCAIFVGQDDEQLNPEKVLMLEKCFENHASLARIISKTDHFSLMIKAPDLFEEAWKKFLQAQLDYTVDVASNPNETEIVVK